MNTCFYWYPDDCHEVTLCLLKRSIKLLKIWAPVVWHMCDILRIWCCCMWVRGILLFPWNHIKNRTMHICFTNFIKLIWLKSFLICFPKLSAYILVLKVVIFWFLSILFKPNRVIPPSVTIFRGGLIFSLKHRSWHYL